MSKQNKKHSFKRTEDKKSISQIVKDRLLNKSLSIQLPLIEEKFGEIVKSVDQGIVVNFKNFIPPQSSIILTGFIDGFYTEIELKVVKLIQESLYLCKSSYLRICSQRRIEPRYKVTDHETFFVKNIKISKIDVSLQGGSVPVGYKILLERFEKENADIAEIVRIGIFGKKSKIHQEVHKTCKTYYVSDSGDDASFEHDENSNDDLINLQEFYGETLTPERKKMTDKKIIGRIVSPILGPGPADTWIAIGYIDIMSGSPLDIIKLMEIKSLSFEIIDAVRDLSVMIIKEKQKVLDVSKSGICIQVTDKDCINAMLHRPQFIFNIMIKGQAPITVTGWIRMKKKLEDGSLLIGVKLLGQSDRPDQMLRYYEYIKKLEKQSKGKS